MRAGKTIVGVTAAAVGLILAGGCQLIAGVKDTLPYPADGGTSGTGGQGGGGPSTTGGGGGATICAPGSEIGCYSGPDGTKGVGICQEGKKTCRTDGSGYDACVGEVKPKAESCAAKEDENCDGYDCVQWAELFGDGADQQANAITVDTAGNIYVVGTFSGQIKTPTMTLTDAGSGDAFILKVDASGTPVWAKSFGDSSTQSVSAIALDSTGSFVVGGWSDTSFSLGGPDVAAGLFVAKFTSDGQHVWSKGLGSSGCGSPSGRIAAISTTAGNDFILGGSFCGSIDVGDGPKMSAGSEDAFVAQVRGGDGSGAKLKGGWIRTYGDSKSQEINDVVVDVTHSEILGIGDFSGTIVTGSKTLTSFDTSLDMFYVRLFPDGSDIWAASYGAAGIQVATDAVITKAGNLVIAGQFSDPFDIQGHTITAPAFSGSTFLVSIDFSDSYAWSKVIAAEKNSGVFTTSLKINATENLILTGFFNGSVDFGDGSFQPPGATTNIFLAKLTSSGQGVWSRHIINTTSGLPVPWAAVAPTGDPVIGGFMSDSIDFGTGLLSPKGAQDIFLAKFAP